MNAVGWSWWTLSIALFASWVQHQCLFSALCYILGHLWSWCLCYARNQSVISGAFYHLLCIWEWQWVHSIAQSPVAASILAQIIFMPTSPLELLAIAPPCWLYTLQFVITLNYELFGRRIVLRSFIEYWIAIFLLNLRGVLLPSVAAVAVCGICHSCRYVSNTSMRLCRCWRSATQVLFGNGAFSLNSD